MNRKFVSLFNDKKIIRSCFKASLKDKKACCSVVLFYLSSTIKWHHVMSMLEKLEDIKGVIGSVIEEGQTSQ
jgi:hypothetical protein